MAKNKSTTKRRKAKRRAAIPPAKKSELLRLCQRRCCICFGLRRILDVKDGQIAHLDRDRSNCAIENLAYLCLECHKQYDNRNNRVLSFTADEIEVYRAQLYRALGRDQIEWNITVRGDRSQYEAVKKSIDRAHAILRKCGLDASLNETPIE